VAEAHENIHEGELAGIVEFDPAMRFTVAVIAAAPAFTIALDR
jgi:hypothetical protein